MEHKTKKGSKRTPAQPPINFRPSAEAAEALDYLVGFYSQFIPARKRDIINQAIIELAKSKKEQSR